jgi:cubilin
MRNLSFSSMLLVLLFVTAGCPTTSPRDDDDAAVDDDDSAVDDDDDATSDDDDATSDDDDATSDDDDATSDDDDATSDDDDATGDDDDATSDDDDATSDDDDATTDDDDSAVGDDDDSGSVGDDDDSGSVGDDDDSAVGDDDDATTGDDDDSAVGDDDDSAVGDDDDSAGPAAQCDPLTVLTALSGSFDDGSGPGADYDINLLCGWLIDLDPSSVGTITLTFSSFELENNYDFLTVYDGADATAPVLAQYTGSALPPTLVVSGSQVYVEFESDFIVTAEGFELSWVGGSGCGGASDLLGASGSFSDGSGTGDYANNSDCSWLINGQGAAAVTLTFTAFDTEAGFDFVTVFDGVDANAPVLGQFSGSALPAAITSTGNFLFVLFESDFSLTAGGFAASWASTYTPCAGPQTLVAPTGVLTDGSGPGANYPANASCSWLIDVPGAEVLAITFSAFATESGYDYVTIYDGPDATSPVLVEFSGTAPLDVIVAASFGPLYVEFTSDSIINGAGFLATYTTTAGGPCAGNVVLEAPVGILSDGPGNYANNSTCSWTIDVAEAAGVLIDFGVLETEATYDFVDVYDGLDASAPLLGSYDGTPPLPVSLASTSGQLFVDLSTDSTVTAPGFTAIYGAVFVDCSGPSTLTALSGGFGDGSGPDASYLNSQSCSWLIDGPATSTVELTAVYYDLESNYDYVELYDGGDATAPSLASLNGQGANEVYQSTGNQLYVAFDTDTSVTYDGFWLEYVILP